MDTKNNKMVDFLKSNVKEVKDAKATLVGGVLEKTYRRAIEDLCDTIESSKTQETARLLSLIPNNILTNSVVKDDFDADIVMKEDIESSIKMKKDMEHLDIFLAKYTERFGNFENTAMIERVAPELAEKYFKKEA